MTIVIAGVGLTPFGRHPERSLRDLAASAASAALADAGMTVADIERVYFANAMATSITGQEMIRGQVSLRELGVGGIGVYNVENACASASTAFSLAYEAIAGGHVEVALAIGAEKMSHEDRERTYRGLSGALDVEADPGDSDGSPFMQIYANLAAEYLASGRATVEDFAAVAAKNHSNAALNPMAHRQTPMTVREVMESPGVVGALTRLMCSPVSDGAAAAVLVSKEFARSRGLNRTVAVQASVVRSGRVEPATISASVRASTTAYENSGLGPYEIGLFEVHDAAAPAEVHLYEEIGLAEEGAALIRSGATQLGGTMPVNTSGGLIARGHPVGATGLAQIHEVVTQLRGEAGERQAGRPRHGLAHNAGGWLGSDNAAAVVTVLSAL